ncbi:MAG TPA: hypothetical protein PLD59_05875, partial [Tepidisphaeraceae bacterium]|nr:hypothetical protein [Tepidisphaeraceae bacterium]
GRCGRVGPGICIRLYSEDDFARRETFTQPEILRTNLAAVILQMAALRLGDVSQFPFIDPPDPRLVRDGYATLHELGAIDEHNVLTSIGRKLARLPVDPRIGRMVLAAVEEDCLAEVLVVASALSVQDPRERPFDKADTADFHHARFKDDQSDFISYLKLWDYYHDRAKHLSRSQLRKLCKAEFLSYVRLREWHEVHHQLRTIVAELSLPRQRKRRHRPRPRSSPELRSRPPIDGGN